MWPPLPTASSSSPTSSTAEGLDPVCPKTGTFLASSWGDWWGINAISIHQACYATARPDCTSPFPLPRSKCCQRPGLLGRSSAVNSRDTQPSQMLERSQQLDLGRTGQSEMEALDDHGRRRGKLIYPIMIPPSPLSHTHSPSPITVASAGGRPQGCHRPTFAPTSAA